MKSSGNNEFCHKCSLVVAPFTPGRTVVGKNVFHPECFHKHLVETRELRARAQVAAQAHEPQQEQVLQTPFLSSGEFAH